MKNNFLKSINPENDFESNYDFLMKGIDKSKNHLKSITDSQGRVRKVWVSNDSADTTPAGGNAGKSYEKTGKRHAEHSGFKSGDEVHFTAGGKTIKGVFRHVNENKHGALAVVRGEDGKLYERTPNKLTVAQKTSAAKTSSSKELADRYKEVAAYNDPELSHGDIYRSMKTTHGVKTRKELEDALKEHKVPIYSYLSDEEKEENRIKSTPVKKESGENVAKTGKSMKEHMAAASKAEPEKKAAQKKFIDESTDKYNNNKSASKSSDRDDLIHDLKKVKAEHKKIAPTKHGQFDDNNDGDESSLAIQLKQWKTKLTNAGGDHSKLGLKYVEKTKAVGKSTAE